MLRRNQLGLNSFVGRGPFSPLFPTDRLSGENKNTISQSNEMTTKDFTSGSDSENSCVAVNVGTSFHVLPTSSKNQETQCVTNTNPEICYCPHTHDKPLKSILKINQEQLTDQTIRATKVSFQNSLPNLPLTTEQYCQPDVIYPVCLQNHANVFQNQIKNCKEGYTKREISILNIPEVKNEETQSLPTFNNIETQQRRQFENFPQQSFSFNTKQEPMQQDLPQDFCVQENFVPNNFPQENFQIFTANMQNPVQFSPKGQIQNSSITQKETIFVPPNFYPSPQVLNHNITLPTQNNSGPTKDLAYFHPDRFELLSDARALIPEKIRVDVLPRKIDIYGCTQYCLNGIITKVELIRTYELPHRVVPQRSFCFLHHEGILIVSAPWEIESNN